MYTYTRLPERVIAYEIRSIDKEDPTKVKTERGDIITLSTKNAKVGDYIIVEHGDIGLFGNKQVEQWVTRAKFKADYRRD